MNEHPLINLGFPIRPKNLQVIEWQKVAEDWIRAGRQLKVLHYEEVTPTFCQIGFYIVGNLDLIAPQTSPNYLSIIGGQRPCQFHEGHPQLPPSSS